MEHSADDMSDYLQLSNVSAADHHQQLLRRRLFHSSSLYHTTAGRTSSDATVAPRRPILPGPSSTPTVRRQLPTILVPTADWRRFGFKRTLSTDSIDSADETFRRLNMDVPAPPSPSPVVCTPPKSPSPLSTNDNDKSPVPARKCSTPTLAVCGRSKTDPGSGDNEPSDSDTLSPLYSAKTGKLPAGADGSPLPMQKRSTPDMRSTSSSTASTSVSAALKMSRTKTIQQETVADVVGLSPYQQRLLLQTWPNIYGTGSSSFGLSVFNALCNNNNNAKMLMQKANSVAVFTQSGTDCTGSHAKLTLDLLDTIVRNLDGHSDLIISHLRSVGTCHRTLKAEGLRTQVWEDLGDALRATIRKHEPVRKHKELGRAWLSLVSFIIDNLKQGQDSSRSVAYPAGATTPGAE